MTGEGWYLAGETLHRVTALYGRRRIQVVERAVGTRWEVVAALPDDAKRASAAVLRHHPSMEMVDSWSAFSFRPERPASDFPSRATQLDSMIEQTTAWLRAAASDLDGDATYVEHGSLDHDEVVDRAAEVDNALSALAMLTAHRADIDRRAALRRTRGSRGT